jgi:hypothetical protein
VKRRFYCIIEVQDDEWDGDKQDMATWIDAAMNYHDIESTVWDNLADFQADNVLDSLAEL